jgi:hypothetical protein
MAVSATEASKPYWEMGTMTSPIGFHKVDEIELIDDMGGELGSDASISRRNQITKL